MSVHGEWAAWPDPIDLPITALWTLPEEDLPGTPLNRYREICVIACRAWRDRAGTDGWDIVPTYEHEPIDCAWTATRDGFKVMGIARPLGHLGSRVAVATLHIWGPDRGAIKPMPVYDWEAIQRGAWTCHGCGVEGLPLDRVAFAGRYCQLCAPAERRAQEYPGWCD